GFCAASPPDVPLALWCTGQPARTLAIFLFAAAPGRRSLRLRDPSRIFGRKRRRVPGAEPVADATRGRTGKSASKTRGSFQLRAPRTGNSGATLLCHGVRRPQHGVLDRAPRQPGKGFFTTETPRHGESGENFSSVTSRWREYAPECLSAGHSHRRRTHS